MRNSTTEPNGKESKWETQRQGPNEKEVNGELNDRTKRKGSKWKSQWQNQNEKEVNWETQRQNQTKRK